MASSASFNLSLSFHDYKEKSSQNKLLYYETNRIIFVLYVQQLSTWLVVLH